jgi:hypothetical protein
MPDTNHMSPCMRVRLVSASFPGPGREVVAPVCPSLCKLFLSRSVGFPMSSYIYSVSRDAVFLAESEDLFLVSGHGWFCRE